MKSPEKNIVQSVHMLFTLGFLISFSCVIYARETYFVEPTHLLEENYYNSMTAAKDACEVYRKHYGYSDTCLLMYRKPNFFESGWVSERGQNGGIIFPVRLGHFYYPSEYYLVAAESSPSCYIDRSNPCDVLTGRKLQREVDFTIGSIQFIRYYDSGTANPGTNIGNYWRHSFDSTIDNQKSHLEALSFPVYTSSSFNRSELYPSEQEACHIGWGDVKNRYLRGIYSGATPSYSSTGVCIIRDGQKTVAVFSIFPVTGYQHPNPMKKNYHSATLATGAHFIFRKDEADNLEEINDSPIELTQIGEYWEVKYDHTIDRFQEGRLISRKLANGHNLVIEQDTYGRLATIKDPLNNTIHLSYNELGQIIKAMFKGGEVTYQYDDRHNLAAVSYPDGTSKHYHYEDNHYGHLLTGITDENGNRYATWAYDNQGRAILSEHAGGAERVEFTYNNDGSTTVTDANGAQRTYHFVIARNTLKVSHITGDQCKTCPNGHIQAYTYDSSGFIATETDWEGHITHYTRDPQGRELTRIEAYGTPEARTISTLWNTALNKPAQITYPDRKEIYTYNEQGLLIKTEHLPLNP